MQAQRKSTPPKRTISGMRLRVKDPDNERRGRKLQELRHALYALEGEKWTEAAVISRGGPTKLRAIEAGTEEFTRAVFGLLALGFGCDLRPYLAGNEEQEEIVIRCLLRTRD